MKWSPAQLVAATRISAVSPLLLEVAPFAVALASFPLIVRDRSVILMSDNSGAAGGVASRVSTCPDVTALWRLFTAQQIEVRCHASGVYMAREENTLADLLSRGDEEGFLLAARKAGLRVAPSRSPSAESSLARWAELSPFYTI